MWFLYKSLPDEFKSIRQAEQFMSERYGVDYSKALSGIKQRKLHQFEVSSINTKTELKVMPKTKLAPFKSGKATYTYFFKRGFDKEDMRYWRVGRDIENKTVTIPVFSQDNQLVGVIGRYIDPNRPKNSRYKIYGFQKGSIVFPADKIKPVKRTLIVVEGMLDCMMLHKWGRINTGALMGAKMTVAQADFIADNCDRVILLFDNDTGGKTAEQIARKRLRDRVDILTCDYSIVDGKGKDPSEWGELLTNKLISTASLVKHTLQKI